MKVTRRCRESSLEITTHDLLVSRTIRGLAARISDNSAKLRSSANFTKVHANARPDIVALLPVTTDEVKTVVPATPYESQIYEASHRHAGRPYFATYLARVTRNGSQKNVDIERFSRAWQGVVERHPIMRTVFIVDPSDSTLYQVVLHGVHAKITTQVVEDDDDPAENLLADHVSFTRKLTNPNAGMKLEPAHEVVLYQSHSGPVLLRLSISHLVTDSVALEHIFADMDTFYNRHVPEKPSVAFDNYARWFKPDVVVANNKVWHEKILHQVQACFLLETERKPQGYPAQLMHEISLPFSITLAQRMAIVDFCKAAQVTISSFFSFCWALLLKECTKQDIVCFGQLVAGRDAPVDSLDYIVGPVLSVLPTLVEFSCSSRSPMELIQQFQKANIDAAAYQPCSLKSMEKSIGCSADRGFFNTVVNVRKVHYQGQELEVQLLSRGLQFELIKSYDTSEVRICRVCDIQGDANHVIQYDFVLQIDERGRDISGVLNFWNYQFELEKVQGILYNYLRILDQISQSIEVYI